MSQIIAGEAYFFLASLLTGALILFGYDILRGLRRGVPHSGSMISLEDFFYWSAAGAVVFFTAYQRNSGSVRGYAVAALVLGMILYYQTLSPLVLWIVSFVFGHFYRGIGTFCRLILSPAGKSLKKVWKIAGKILKKRVKEVRIIVRKK